MDTKEYLNKISEKLNAMPLHEFEKLVHQSMQGSSRKMVEIHNKVTKDNDAITSI